MVPGHLVHSIRVVLRASLPSLFVITLPATANTVHAARPDGQIIHATPVATNQQCGEYAKSAVADFNQANGLPKCVGPMKRDSAGRWHNDYKRHYDWCLTAQQTWLNSEKTQRTKLLVDCGGRTSLD